LLEEEGFVKRIVDGLLKRIGSVDTKENVVYVPHLKEWSNGTTTGKLLRGWNMVKEVCGVVSSRSRDVSLKKSGDQ
jgi:hypothetical protein